MTCPLERAANVHEGRGVGLGLSRSGQVGRPRQASRADSQGPRHTGPGFIIMCA